jgi:hypothetical protein
MSNRFAFEITAVDRYTKVFRDLNNKASKAMRPLTSAQRSIASLGREMHLPAVAKGMERITRSSLNIASSMGALSPQMQAAFGAGVAGSIGGVAASIAALGVRSMNTGNEISRTAQALSMATGTLQSYRGAARLVGIETEAATAGFLALQNALYGATFGTNREAELVFHKLGVTIKKNRDGTIDTAAAFDDLARAISKIQDPHTQAAAADALGIGALLPLLREGEAGLARLKAMIERVNGVIGKDSVEEGRKYTEQLNLMKISWEALATVLGAKAFPAISRTMEALTDLSRARDGGKDFAARIGEGLWEWAKPGKDRSVTKLWTAMFGESEPGSVHLKPEDRARAARISTGRVSSGAGSGPTSFRDPAYDVLDADVEKRLGLPSGLLSGIRKNGERSNADQVSSAGARTVYQVTPSTRDLALKKWGIDAYSGAAQASEVAGHLLKDSLDRNGGDVSAAIGEYHGGTDRRNWGPINAAYRERVGGPLGAGDTGAAPQSIRVEVAFANAPPGLQVRARTDTGSSVPIRVSTAMGGVTP